jgi:hypothetical protein
MTGWKKVSAVALAAVVGALVLSVQAECCGCPPRNSIANVVEVEPQRIPRCWRVCSECCNVGCYYTWRCLWCLLLGEPPIGVWAGDLYACEDGSLECRDYGFRYCTCAYCAYHSAISIPI